MNSLNLLTFCLALHCRFSWWRLLKTSPSLLHCVPFMHWSMSFPIFGYSTWPLQVVTASRIALACCSALSETVQLWAPLDTWRRVWFSWMMLLASGLWPMSLLAEWGSELAALRVCSAYGLALRVVFNRSDGSLCSPRPEWWSRPPYSLLLLRFCCLRSLAVYWCWAHSFWQWGFTCCSGWLELHLGRFEQGKLLSFLLKSVPDSWVSLWCPSSG